MTKAITSEIALTNKREHSLLINIRMNPLIRLTLLITKLIIILMVLPILILLQLLLLYPLLISPKLIKPISRMLLLIL